VVVLGDPVSLVGSVVRAATGRSGRAALTAPAAVIVLAAFVLPMVAIIWLSVSTPHLGLATYRDLLAEDVTVRVLLRTPRMAAIVTAVTLVLGYPYAYAMTVASPRTRGVLIALVLMPFWTSLMARTFAWVVLLSDNGLINQILQGIGLGPVALLRTSTGVTIGMSQVLLPFMVLPLYSHLRTIDLTLMSAAQGMGARPSVAFRRVYLPLSLPGVVSGATLTYILALGFYITPRLLGSPRDAMISQLLALKVERLLAFDQAGALGAILIVVTLLLLAVTSRVVKPAAALGLTDPEAR
jgi:putative spermidine/putrescine transport system permease protein